MRFIVTIVWAIIISGVVSYVLSAMADSAFNVTHTLILAALISVAVFILGEGLLKETED